ncbi:4101_t:CDS:1 [Ambispora leptoticha]|uniref:4101_t:CDS:1 n=1 Tax=Ambispora leptoticha TaxID=144679 RepID=A0A9N8VYD0_9GLOM|nr:4101_t:CDS:1 [Ambispora leptoticha]
MPISYSIQERITRENQARHPRFVLGMPVYAAITTATARTTTSNTEKEKPKVASRYTNQTTKNSKFSSSTNTTNNNRKGLQLKSRRAHVAISYESTSKTITTTTAIKNVTSNIIDLTKTHEENSSNSTAPQRNPVLKDLTNIFGMPSERQKHFESTSSRVDKATPSIPNKNQIVKPNTVLNKDQNVKPKTIHVSEIIGDLVPSKNQNVMPNTIHDSGTSGALSSIDEMKDQKKKKSPFELYRSKKNCLSVTDFAALAWCETQFEFTLADGGRRQTEVMAKGSEIHLTLELEVHEIVEVKLKTREDRWGNRLLNLLTGLFEIQEQGKTRELPMFGFIEQFLVFGVIDEVERRPISNEESVPVQEPPVKRHKREIESLSTYSKTALFLSDTKTRSKPYISQNSTPGNKYQLMLYKRLFDEFMLYGINEERLYKAARIDPDASFSREFGNHVHKTLTALDNPEKMIQNFDDDDKANKGNKIFKKIMMIKEETETDEHPENTIRTLMLHIKNQSTKFTKSSKELELSYRYQGDGKIIGTHKYIYDGVALQKYLKRCGDFWKGLRAATGVEIEEAWKCCACDYVDVCEWRARKAKELEEKSKLLIAKSHNE